MCRKEELLDLLKERHDLEVLLTIGAGDIDQMLGEIKGVLEKNYL